MLPTNLEELTHEDLIALALAMAKQLADLQALVAQMKGDYEALQFKLNKLPKPPIDSKNSSQPPSRDQKSNKKADRPKRKHDAGRTYQT